MIPRIGSYSRLPAANLNRLIGPVSHTGGSGGSFGLNVRGSAGRGWCFRTDPLWAGGSALRTGSMLAPLSPEGMIRHSSGTVSDAIARGAKIMPDITGGDCSWWLGRRLGLDMRSLADWAWKFDQFDPVKIGDVKAGDTVAYGFKDDAGFETISSRFAKFMLKYYIGKPKYFNFNGERLMLMHVGIVSRIDENGKIFVTSKWGEDPVIEAPYDLRPELHGDHAMFFRPVRQQ